MTHRMMIRYFLIKPYEETEFVIWQNEIVWRTTQKNIDGLIAFCQIMKKLKTMKSIYTKIWLCQTLSFFCAVWFYGQYI